jgi:predicted nuclease of predicted toxin-antitoxin system
LPTKLRLLLDECLEGPLAGDIAKHKALNVEWINDTLMASRGFTDQNVVDYAREQRRIVVTTEGRLNEKKFTICTHPGIVVLKATRRHASLRAGMFHALVASGHRSRCNHAVTYLKLDETATRTIALFKERDDNGVVQETTIDLTQRVIIGATRTDFTKQACT